jgi:hypothetical protein
MRQRQPLLALHLMNWWTAQGGVVTEQHRLMVLFGALATPKYFANISRTV